MRCETRCFGASRADCFHATAESGYEDLRRLGFRQPVCVLSNGIDIPPLERPPEGFGRRLLYLGRIHEKKGIDMLLRAWRAVQAKFPDWELVLAGRTPPEGERVDGEESFLGLTTAA